MKSKISIKSFFIAIFLVVFVLQIVKYYGLFKSTESNVVSLLRENLQAKVLVLKHFLEKNLQKDNINAIVTFIDNAVVTSSIIKDVHIVNDRGELLYATDRDAAGTHHADARCIALSQVVTSDLRRNGCFEFTIRLYERLEPYFYHIYVYTDETYIESLLVRQKEKYFIIFFFYIFVVFPIFWYLLHKFITQPLELLRQYAYYNMEEPREFLISELESIRYSLKMTFHRLKKEQEELYKLSTKDSLSGLYNRLSLIEKLNWLIDKSKRDGSRFAIIFIDLDDFKTINDSKGHDFGDTILKKVAALLVEAVRKNDIVARFGGDEFVVLLPDFGDETMIVEVAKRIQRVFRTPIDNNRVTASMGIAVFPKDGRDPTTLLKNADIAMYMAKDMGKNKFHFFTESLNKVIEEHIHIQHLIQNALSKGHFELYYQPKVEIATNKIVGCEALIRLNDPHEGLITPDRFISVAEKSGLIVEMGRWVLQEAALQLRRWEDTPLKDVKISVNVSAVQFHEKNFIKKLKRAITDVQTRKLELELTESALIDDFETTMRSIEEIKAMGLSLSLDDFGTGYSSLSYLKEIPFDTLKIDKSFVDDIEGKQSKSFVEMIVNISKTLELEVVAEGVETQEQLELLREMGCDVYQGYLCSPPLPVEKFEALFASFRPR